MSQSPANLADCISALVGQPDVLIVVPPFGVLHAPTLGPHLLQAIARHEGFDVCVLYATFSLAAETGEHEYESVVCAPVPGMLGDRLFASTAFDVPPLGRDACHSPSEQVDTFRELHPGVDLPVVFDLEARSARWMNKLIRAIAALDIPVVGCSVLGGQLASSVALLRGLKRACPSVVTILGGACCAGEMAQGIYSLDAGIDYVFSGESETTFVSFLHARRRGERVQPGVITGQPCKDLDCLPAPHFADFYDQLHQFLPGAKLVRGERLVLAYQTSRGCWWARTSRCTFCGLCGSEAGFRTKSLDRAVAELRVLRRHHPSNRVALTDNSFGRARLHQLVARFREHLPGLQFWATLRAPLSLADVVALSEAGFDRLQPGIEALSTSLLSLMRKGTTARQNLDLLRYARCAGISVLWNLLSGLPGDQTAEYEQTLARLPLLRHLSPPKTFGPIRLDRFSPYFDEPASFGIRSLWPIASYAAILPEHADAYRIACHFDGDFPSASRDDPELMRRIRTTVTEWRAAWDGDSSPPVLEVTQLSSRYYLLLDTRRVAGGQEISFLSRDQAAVALSGTAERECDLARWALERKLAIETDDYVVPLATADPALLAEFEAELANKEAATLRGMKKNPGSPWVRATS